MFGDAKTNKWVSLDFRCFPLFSDVSESTKMRINGDARRGYVNT